MKDIEVVYGIDKYFNTLEQIGDIDDKEFYNALLMVTIHLNIFEFNNKLVNDIIDCLNAVSCLSHTKHNNKLSYVNQYE